MLVVAALDAKAGLVNLSPGRASTSRLHAPPTPWSSSTATLELPEQHSGSTWPREAMSTKRICAGNSEDDSTWQGI
jgi:hypothetical protein